jgi:MoaA/NifB/PqqE/SkfB family radical SAM enzyme/SAM-dependent methyltransferase
VRAILSVCHESNNKRLDCASAGPGDSRSLSIDQIQERIARLGRAGVKTVILTGGEPCIRRDFFEILDFVRQCGLRPGMTSNGRMLAYGNFARQYAQFRPEFTQIQLFSHDPEIHDLLAGVSGAFAQTVSGIHKLAGMADDVTVCVPVIKRNAGHIRDIAVLLRGLKVRARIKFSQGAGSFSLPYEESLLAGSQQAAESVHDALSHGMSTCAGRGLSFCWEGFATCMMDEFSHMCADAPEEDVILAWDMDKEDFQPVPMTVNKGNAYEECLACSRRTRCYANRRHERLPFLERTPNAVGYDFVGTVEPRDEPSCPAGRELCAGLHPIKDTVVLQDAVLQIFRSDGHASAFEMSEVKFSRQQLYLNISGRARGLDFRTAFMRLAMHEACSECELRHIRAGVFVPVEGDAFAHVQEMEKHWLSRLRGRVLDIGCGRPMFPELLQQMAAEGLIEYLGVDPCPDCPAGLCAVAGDFESFDWTGEPFDHIIMLRSYNHFKDPRTVLKKAAALAAPGGFLHIFENGLFAMLNRDVVDDKQPDAHQHYRNHFSEQVINLLACFPEFEVSEHKPVKPHAANQWFLSLRRTAANPSS